MSRARRRRLLPGRPDRRTRGAVASRRGSPAPGGGRRTARGGAAPGRGEVGREEEGPRYCARPPARRRRAVPRALGGPQPEVERERQQDDDVREHRCGSGRHRVGRHASRPSSRRAVGRGGRGRLPRGVRQGRRRGQAHEVLDAAHTLGDGNRSVFPMRSGEPIARSSRSTTATMRSRSLSHSPGSGSGSRPGCTSRSRTYPTRPREGRSCGPAARGGRQRQPDRGPVHGLAPDHARPDPTSRTRSCPRRRSCSRSRASCRPW